MSKRALTSTDTSTHTPHTHLKNQPTNKTNEQNKNKKKDPVGHGEWIDAVKYNTKKPVKTPF